MATHTPPLTSEERLDSAEYRLDEIERMFKEAFPNGDHIGHQRYHAVQIEILLARRKLIAAIQERAIGGLVWAAMLAAGIALWQWFKRQVLGGV